MTYSRDTRAAVCLKIWQGKPVQVVADDHFMHRVTVRRIWQQFKKTGSCEPSKADRERRSDCQLTLTDIAWIADRIKDTPDLYVSELRRVFVHFHPHKNFVSEYAIVQALMVRCPP